MLSVIAFIIEMLFIFNPILKIPPILALTKNETTQTRQRILNIALSVASFIVILFSILGEYIVQSLELTQVAIYFTGAILIGNAAFRMIVPTHIKRSTSMHVAIYPIAIPYLSGPGTISFVISNLQNCTSNNERLQILALIVLTLIMSYIIISYGVRMLAWLPSICLDSLSCIFGMLLMMIASKIFIKGIICLFKSIIDNAV